MSAATHCARAASARTHPEGSATRDASLGGAALNAHVAAGGEHSLSHPRNADGRVPHNVDPRNPAAVVDPRDFRRGCMPRVTPVRKDVLKHAVHASCIMPAVICNEYRDKADFRVGLDGSAVPVSVLQRGRAVLDAAEAFPVRAWGLAGYGTRSRPHDVSWPAGGLPAPCCIVALLPLDKRCGLRLSLHQALRPSREIAGQVPGCVGQGMTERTRGCKGSDSVPQPILSNMRRPLRRAA